MTGALSQPYLLGEVGEAAPPSVDVVGGFVSGTGRGTGLAIGGGGGGGHGSYLNGGGTAVGGAGGSGIILLRFH